MDIEVPERIVYCCGDIEIGYLATLPFSNKRVSMTTTGGFWSQIIWMKSERVRALGPEPLQQNIYINHSNK